MATTPLPSLEPEAHPVEPSPGEERAAPTAGRPGWAFFRLFLAALFIRLPLALVNGFKGDQFYWELMSRNAVDEGWTHVYRLTAREPWLGIYPPLYHALLGFVGHLYKRWFAPAFEVPSPELNAMLKLVPITGDMLIGCVIYAVARRIAGARVALGAAAVFLFNPAIICCSSYWGMFGDPPYTLMSLLAVVALWAGRFPLAWMALAIGVLIKPQATMFAPLLLWATLRGSKPKTWLAAAGLGAATTGAVLLPFVLAGTFGEMVSCLSKTVGLFPVLSANAHNFWFLWSGGNPWQSDAIRVAGLLPARTLGLAAFGLAYAYALWKLGPPPFGERLFATAAYAGFAFFMLATEMHENYTFPALTFLALMSWKSRRWQALAIVLSCTVLANMVLHDPGVRLSQFVRHRDLVTLRVWNSGLQVAIFAAWTVVLAMGRGRGAASPRRLPDDWESA
jgi:dolichyl-phosphate-mannose-protein mannosyltransferase